MITKNSEQILNAKKNIKRDQIIESLISKCDANEKYYEGYIRSNYERIYADASFLRTILSNDSKILDVGGVPPLFVHLLKGFNFTNLAVVDPNPETFSTYFREANINAIQGNLLVDMLSEYQNAFDCVCLNEVIEHLSGNLLTAIENVAGCLKPGGYLMVTTPNMRSFSGLFALLFYRSGLASKPFSSVREQYDRATAQYGYYGHLREFTSHEVVCLFKSLGFDLVKRQLQPDFRNSVGFMRVAKVLENLFPKWALFGKYIFRKRVLV